MIKDISPLTQDVRFLIVWQSSKRRTELIAGVPPLIERNWLRRFEQHHCLRVGEVDLLKRCSENGSDRPSTVGGKGDGSANLAASVKSSAMIYARA